MALNTSKCNLLTPLHCKELISKDYRHRYEISSFVATEKPILYFSNRCVKYIKRTNIGMNKWK